MRSPLIRLLPLLWLIAAGCSDDVASAGSGADDADITSDDDAEANPDTSQDTLLGDKDVGEPSDATPQDVPSSVDGESTPDALPPADILVSDGTPEPDSDTSQPSDATGSEDTLDDAETGEDTETLDIADSSGGDAPEGDDIIKEDAACIANCEGKACGDDGCGGECGECAQDEACSADGVCECVPNCADKQCGLNGCGGLCGLCPAGILCGPTGLCVGSVPAATCEDLMECMVEVGCSCQGINCPTNIGARLECIDDCQASNPCTTFCFGADPEVEEALLALDTCVETNCPDVTADCLLDACGPQAEVCLQEGIWGCTDILNCVDDCDDEACAASCTLQASAAAVLQYEAHGNCVETLCADATPPCEAWADAVVCPQLIPACGVVTGTGLCDVAESCTFECGLLDPSPTCLESCMTGLDPEAAASFADAATCALSLCEGLPGGITGSCLFAALTGPTCVDFLADCAPCDVALLTEFQPAFAVASMVVGTGGDPGEALNIDPENGPDDCAPPNSCSDGLDNQLAILAGFGINSALEESIASGALAIIGEADGAPGPIGVIHIYSGGASNSSCPLAQGGCDALLAKESFGSDCVPIASVGNVVVDADGAFTAGGDDAIIPLPLAFEAGTTLVIPLRRARLAGTLVLEAGGVSLTDTVFGGALRKDELAETIAVLPGDSFAGLPKDLVLSLLATMLPDIDTDGDGVDDALSIGLAVTAVPTTIVGVE